MRTVDKQPDAKGWEGGPQTSGNTRATSGLARRGLYSIVASEGWVANEPWLLGWNATAEYAKLLQSLGQRACESATNMKCLVVRESRVVARPRTVSFCPRCLWNVRTSGKIGLAYVMELSELPRALPIDGLEMGQCHVTGKVT